MEWKRRERGHMKNKVKSMAKWWGKFWQENKVLVKPWLVLSGIYLAAVSAIILAGVHYADDVARTGQGYAGWSGFSRYLSTILSHGLHADNYLTNIAPLLQLLAVGLLALAGVMVICVVSGRDVFKEKWTRWIWRVIAVVPMGLVPYMLECLSYQYDAVYMALSVVCAVMPLMFRKRLPSYCLATVIGILVVCMTYQASIGIYPMLVVFMAMKEWAEERKADWRGLGKFVGLSVVVFAVTVVVFQKFLMTPREVYASNAVPGIGEFFPKFFEHLGTYFELVVSDFRMLWLVLVGLIAVLFVVMYVVRSRRNKVLAGVVGVVGMVVMAVMAYVMYAALEQPLYTTRAMYAIGAWIAVMGVYVTSGSGYRWLSVVSAVPVVVLAWCWFVFGFTYGNMLAEQNAYRNMVVDMALGDLNELMVKMGEGSKVVQVKGQIGWAPAVASTPEGDYRMLRRLLKPSFGTDVPWMGYKITQGSGIPGLVYNGDLDISDWGLPLMKETVLYNVYGDSKGVLVEFKGEEFGLEY